MHAGELRSRLTAIGLTLNHFTRLAGMDSRNARRQESGQTPVTDGTVRALYEAEGLSDELTGDYRANGEAVVPRWSNNAWHENERFPPSFYHASAARLTGHVPIRYEDEERD